MTADSDDAKLEQVRKLRHDLLNCLNVIHMAVQAVEGFDDDRNLRKEMCASIKKEQELAATIAHELCELACQPRNSGY